MVYGLCVFFYTKKGRVIMMLADLVYKPGRRYQYGKLHILETLEQMTDVDQSKCVYATVS